MPSTHAPSATPQALCPLLTNPKSEFPNPKLRAPATRDPQPVLASHLFQHLTALPLVHVIQREAQGGLQQGGFVIDGHTGQFELMKLKVKAIEEVH